MKIYPLESVKPLFTKKNQTFADLGIKINNSLEGLTPTPELLNEKTKDGLKKLISLEFNWLPASVVEPYNSVKTEKERKKILVNKVYGNCKLNCKGCYAKQDSLYKGKRLVHPEVILDLIEEAVDWLDTKTLKYLGPTEFFRDKNIFRYLDRFEKMGIILNVFAKDPMFGDDQEVEELFGDQGLKTSEELIKKLASYKNLRILFHFASFDEEKTNYLIKDGYKGKKNYTGNYKKVQTRAIQLLYKYFVEKEIKKGKESRLVILNSMITPETVDEAFEIFKYFTDRGMLVCSTSSMQSGCGRFIYFNLNGNFSKNLALYYAQAIKYSIKRGIINKKDLAKYGPSPYAGIAPCMQLCSGLLIRETGQLLRCPGADHSKWQDDITPEDLIRDGLLKTWTKTRNYNQKIKVNIGCLAKPKIFTKEFNDRVMELLKSA